MKFLRQAFLYLAVCSAMTAPPLAAEVIVRISDEEIAYETAEFQGRVWVAMESGAYYVDSNSLISVLGGRRVNTLSEIRGEIWLGTNAGIFRVVGAQAFPILQDQIGTPEIMAIRTSPDEVIWIGTSQGLFRVQGGVAARTHVKESVYSVEIIDSEVWVGTTRNAYRIRNSVVSSPLFSGEPRAVSDIVKSAESIWLVTNDKFYQYGPPFRVDGNLPPIPTRGLENKRVTAVAEVEGETWFTTINGVYKFLQGIPLKIDLLGVEEPQNTVAVIDGELWLGSIQRAYRRTTAAAFEPVPRPAERLGIVGIAGALGRTWLWGETGVYRYDPDVKIKIRSSARKILGLRFHFGRRVRIAEARYDRDGQKAYAGTVDGAFGVILETDAQDFDVAIKENLFSPTAAIEHRASYGLQDLYIAGRDAYGNTTEHTRHSVLVLPKLSNLYAGLLATILLIAFAPAFYRRHVLRRYVARLQTRGLQEGWPDRGEVSEETIGYILEEITVGMRGSMPRRQLLLVGDAGMATQYLQRLAWELSTQSTVNSSPLKGRYPIYIRLDMPWNENDSGEAATVEAGAILQLADIGGITNPVLARFLLRSGEFVFLVDDLRSTGKSDQLGLRKFASVNRHTNSIVIGADHLTPTLDGFTTIELDQPSSKDTATPTRSAQGAGISQRLKKLSPKEIIMLGEVLLPMRDLELLKELLRTAKNVGIGRMLVSDAKEGLFAGGRLSANQFVLVGDSSRVSHVDKIAKYVKSEKNVNFADPESAVKYWIPELRASIGERGVIIEVELDGA